jgi:hypothetical protein
MQSVAPLRRDKSGASSLGLAAGDTLCLAANMHLEAIGVGHDAAAGPSFVPIVGRGRHSTPITAPVPTHSPVTPLAVRLEPSGAA